MAWLKEILRVGMTFLVLVGLVLVVGRLTTWLTPSESDNAGQREAAAGEALARIPDIGELMQNSSRRPSRMFTAWSNGPTASLFNRHPCWTARWRRRRDSNA